MGRLEAGGTGLPIVMASVSGATDVVIPGVTGFLVEPAAAELAMSIETLARNTARAKEMGANARKHVSTNFSWDTIGNRTQSLYEEIREVQLEESKNKRVR